MKAREGMLDRVEGLKAWYISQPLATCSTKFTQDTCPLPHHFDSHRPHPTLTLNPSPTITHMEYSGYLVLLVQFSLKCEVLLYEIVLIHNYPSWTYM